MARVPNRYDVHLWLVGGQCETVQFPSLEAFQQWYSGVLNASSSDAFVNVPLGDFQAEYLVVRPSAVIAIRVEPLYSSSES
ncbi:MAG: hypothetical protein ACK52U_15080 [Synechococcaceae cyanobacterium]|jgi:hypothetical protein